MPPHVVEDAVPLSRSILWRLTREYYQRAGPTAWSDGVVPHYVTSNPFVADALAEVALGFMADEGARRATVLEVGAGPGRFAFHFLRALERQDPDAHVRYVASDLVRANVEHLAAHPALAPAIEDGRLDTACFDLERDASLDLIGSGERIDAGDLDEPLIVVANYVLCTLPQDAFQVRDGVVRRALVSTHVTEGPTDLADRDLLRRIDVSWSEEGEDADVGGDPALAAALQDRSGDRFVLFPAAALQALRRIRAFTRRGMLVLAVDRGDVRVDTFPEEPVAPALHGGFSFRPNLHALGRAAELEGGLFLHAYRPAEHIEAVAFAYGDGQRKATAQAFARAVSHVGPDGFFALKRGFDATVVSLPPEAIVAFLAFSWYDPNVFLVASGALAAAAPTASDAVRKAIEAAADEVARNEFTLRDGVGAPDLPFALGSVLYAAGRHEKAIVQFETSIARHGPHRASLLNMAFALRALGRDDEALERLDHALVVDPTFVRAARAREELRGKSAGPAGSSMDAPEMEASRG